MLKVFILLGEISAAFALPDAKSRVATAIPRMVFIKALLHFSPQSLYVGGASIVPTVPK
jgi:hypothetical protein